MLVDPIKFVQAMAEHFKVRRCDSSECSGITADFSNGMVVAFEEAERTMLTIGMVLSVVPQPEQLTPVANP